MREQLILIYFCLFLPSIVLVPVMKYGRYLNLNQSLDDVILGIEDFSCHTRSL